MNWFTHDGQRALGPFPEAQILAWIASGQLRGGNVAPEGTQQWMPLGAHPAFFHALQRAGQPGAHGGAARPPGKSAAKTLVLVAVAGVLVLGVAAYVVTARKSARREAMQERLAEIDARYAPDEERDRKLEAKLESVKVSEDGTQLIAAFKLEGGTDDLKSTAELTAEAPNGGAKIKLDATPRREGYPMWESRYDIGGLSGGRFKGTVRFVNRQGGKAKVNVAFEIPERLRHDKARDEYVCTVHTCSVRVKDGTIVVSAPPDTTVKVGDKSGTGTALSFPAGPLDLLAAANPRYFGSSGAVLSVHLGFKDGSKLEGRIDVPTGDQEQLFKQLLDGVPNKGFRLPGDDEAPAKPRTIAYVDGSKREYFGKGKDMREIDLVALVIDKRHEGSCGSYRNSKTGAIVTVEKTMYNEQVNVYDRRTGKLKAGKYFPAPPEACPESMSGGSVSSFADSSAMKAFVQAQL